MSHAATGRGVGIWALLAGALLACLLVALMVGKYPLRPVDLWQSLAAHLGGDAGSVPERVEIVLWNLRLPRILAALLVGASLSAAGAAYQGMFRNPLVSPDILGVSAGAGLGAVLAIFFGMALPWVQLAAFCGGLLAVASVYLLASRVRRHDPMLVLVLAGVALSALLGAGISLLKVLSDPYTQLASITFWLLGGLNGVSHDDLLGAAPLMLLGALPLILLRWRVNLLGLSDEEAVALGLNVVRTRRLLIVAATLMTASAVAITGIIGWVGLVVPHMARLLVGAEFSRLLPASLLLGGSFLLLTDTLARTVAGMELPLGILTALVGAPCFLVLLARGGRGA